MRLAVLTLIFCFYFILSKAQNPFQKNKIEASDPIHLLFLLYEDELHEYLTQRDYYNIKIIYTEVIREDSSKIFLKTHQMGKDNYFYPASLVKLPVALLALEKLNELNAMGINKYSRMSTFKERACQEAVVGNNPYDQSPPSIAQYIEKMLLVSDNKSYSRLFEFLGSDHIHTRLSEKGYPQTRILTRFASNCFADENKFTNPIVLYNELGVPLYKQQSIESKLHPKPPKGNILLGKAHINLYGQRVHAPLNLTYSNYMSLEDIHKMMIGVMLPEAVPEHERFNLNPEDYQFIRKLLGSYPSEGETVKYLEKDGFYKAYKKYLYYGRKPNTPINDQIRIFNMVGWAYGFLTDCAYFVDYDNNIEFFLSASIYTNENQVLNDNHYEYDEKGFPFLEKLGKIMYDYSLLHPSNFKLNKIFYW